ncbi:facilitated trehalose transporter Tret1-2 homolog [Anthonomus grandis grandis]|uniref:facilitated trehalose transporter Tret1-2 homolog n=1 Tax=Anthonomus grandis grandis TaxID=2921223 RepID=UPI00216566E8|nr:facilitated trehalose transporter Tret1-2 homolog [Anthonomus grandis grandis]
MPEENKPKDQTGYSYPYEPVSKSEKASADGRVEISFAHVEQVPASRTFLYVAACTGNLAAFAAGITLGWTSPVIPKLESPSQTPLSEVISASDKGWIGSLLPLGAVLGPFIAGPLAEKIGRKRTLLFGNLPLVLGLIINLTTSSSVYWLGSRFLCGVSVGLTFTVLPMYVGEIAEDDVRGALGTLLQLFTVIGLLFSYAVGPYMSVTMFNAACLVIPIAFLLTFTLFAPESPYYLLQGGQQEAAEAALMKLRGRSSPEHVKNELETMKSAVEHSLANKAGFMDIFKSKGLTKAFILANGLLVFQQVSGINVVLFFAQTIFQDAGVSLAPEICTIIIGIVQVISSGVASVLVDSQGKRLLLMVSALGMAISQGALAYFFHLKDDKHSDVSALSWLPILCLICYIIAYCLGFGPIPWAVMGEMFPANVKSVASTVTAANCWFFGFILTKYFSVVAELIGKSGSFGLFGGCCAIALVFVYKCLPETTGKSLQEIQDILNGNDTAATQEE